MFRYLVCCDDSVHSLTDFLKRQLTDKLNISFNEESENKTPKQRVYKTEKRVTPSKTDDTIYKANTSSFEIKNYSNTSFLVEHPRTQVKRLLSRNPIFLNISMKIDRNLTVFDYKVIYVISQICNVNLSVEITEAKYKKPREFNPEHKWFSEIRSVIRGRKYYLVGENYHNKIHYRLLLYV